MIMGLIAMDGIRKCKDYVSLLKGIRNGIGKKLNLTLY